jgi:hypothetical protein
MTVSANQTRKTSRFDYDQAARKVAKELKEADNSLIGKGICCIVDWEDLKQLLNNSDKCNHIIPDGHIGEEVIKDKLGLRDSSLDTIKETETVPIVYFRIEDETVKEATLAFYISTRNGDPSIRLPEHGAFPADQAVRRSLNKAFQKIGEWLE